MSSLLISTKNIIEIGLSKNEYYVQDSISTSELQTSTGYSYFNIENIHNEVNSRACIKVKYQNEYENHRHLVSLKPLYDSFGHFDLTAIILNNKVTKTLTINKVNSYVQKSE